MDRFFPISTPSPPAAPEITLHMLVIEVFLNAIKKFFPKEVFSDVLVIC